MNIGIVTAWYSCGAGYVSRNYEYVLKKENNVFIYARGGVNLKKVPTWNNSNVTWAPFHPCSTGIYENHFKKWIDDNSIDVVIFNEQRHWEGVVFSQKMNILIGAYVDYYTSDTVPFFDLYDFLICNTKRHFSVFKNHPQCIYIPWGTDIQKYKPKTKTTRNTMTFLISAGWDGLYAKSSPWLDRRGAGLSMRIFRKIDGNCKLIVLSQVPLEKCPQDWQDNVNEDNRIEFRYAHYDLTPYTDGDIYLYPSRLDGIGLTLTEALSCGLPAITTNSAPMNEFVFNEVNGLLIDVKEYRGRPDGYFWAESICDESKLLEAMNRYIHNPDLIEIHAKNARIIAEQYFSWEINSINLNKWTLSLRKLREKNSRELVNIYSSIKRYDRRINPTPFEKILIGLKGLLIQFIKLFTNGW